MCPSPSDRSSSKRGCNNITSVLPAGLTPIRGQSGPMFSSRLALAAALAAGHFPAAAQAVALDSTTTEAGGTGSTSTAGNDATEVPTPGSAEGAHHPREEHSDDIVVTGVRRRTQDVLGGISVLDAADLTREGAPSIGEA